MIRLIKYECLKIVRQSFFLMLFCLLIIINGSFLFYKIYGSNSEKFSSSDIVTVYNCMEKDGARQGQEMETWLQQAISQIEEGSIEKSLELYERVLMQIESIDSYEDYWETLMSGGNSISAFLNEENSFSERNIAKTRQAYQHLDGLSIKIECSEGMLILVKSEISEQLILSFVFCVLLLLISKEKEDGFIKLTVSTKRGSGYQVISKYLTVILTTIIATIVCFGMNFLFIQLTIGFGDLSRSVQSVYGFQSCPYLLSVGNYMILYLIVKCISMIVAISIFFLFVVLANGILDAIVLAGVYLIFSFGFWTRISPHSWLCILHYFNLFHIFDIQTILGDYQNINIADYPVNQLVVCIAFAGISILGSIMISVRTFGQNRQYFITLKCKIQIWLSKIKKTYILPKTLSGFEWYKLLIINRGFILFGLLVIISIRFTYSESFYMNSREAAYESYCMKIEGKLLTEKKNYLEQEIEKLEKNELFTWERQEGLEQAYKQYKSLEGREQAGLQVDYFSQTGWERYFGPYGRKKDCQIAGVLTIILLLASFQFVTMENDNQMEQIINTVYNGKKLVYRTKMKVLAVYSILLMVVAFIPYTIRLFTYYQMNNWMSDMGSILLFKEQRGFLKILTFFVIYWICRVIGILSNAIIIYFIQRLTKNRIATLLISFFLLLLPIGTALLGITREWGLLPFVTGHAILFWGMI